MNKQRQLQRLIEKIKKADLPLKKEAINLVIGEGNLDTKILFLGEAPGKNEDLTGRPFIGQAGKILEGLLGSIGQKRENVFISSVLHYRPPKNRDPKPSEIEAFKPFVDELIKIINPKMIATLGRHSLNKFIPGETISRVHGKPQKILWEGKEIIIIPLYHPAAVLYRHDLLKTLETDFQIMKQTLEKT